MNAEEIIIELIDSAYISGKDAAILFKALYTNRYETTNQSVYNYIITND